MANIYIIAGPPGIGKSSAGYFFIPEGLTILDPDQIANKYKTQGFTDYKDIGNLKFQDLAKHELISERDFAIELNLGFQSHYDFVKSLKNFSNSNRIKVVLFFTDSIDLCYKRADIRYRSGLHLVSPKIINEMYTHTLFLLITNFSIVTSLIAINVTDSALPQICLEFDKASGALSFKDPIPDWVNKDLKDFLTGI